MQRAIAVAVDSQAIRAMYDRNFTWMIRRAEARLGSRTAAEDAVHDSFAKTLAQIQEGRVRNPEAYLCQVFTNTLIGTLRKSGRLMSLQVEESSQSTDSNEDVEQKYEEGERRELLSEALHSLKPRQRRALSLFSEGLSAAQIAELMQTNSHTVSSLLVRAKSNLKRELIRRGMVPAFLPLFRQRLGIRLKSTLDSLNRLNGGLEQSVVTVALLIGLGILRAPHPANYPQAWEGKPFTESASKVEKHPIVSETKVVTPPVNLHPSSYRDPSRPVSATINPSINVPVGQGGFELREYEKEGKEPSLDDQLASFVSNPFAYIPECHGLIECPTF